METSTYFTKQTASEHLARENARLAAEAREALKHRDEFLAQASHELKTPLTSMLLQAQLLLQAEPGSLSEERMWKTAAFFERQLLRINGLVDEMLTASTLERTRLSLNRLPTNLSELVRTTCEQMLPEFSRRQTELRLDVPEEITGCFDGSRFEQLLTNLLTNALKYAPGRPVTVTLKRREELAVLSVQDQGPGVAAALNERIFERFERGEATEHTSGLGLGLHLARAVAEAHGGRIYLSKEPAPGANFVVELPIRPATLTL